MQITFLDLIQGTYASYGTLANMKGICSFKDPDGIVFYQNAGWSLTAPDFSSPDTNGNTPTWTKGSIAVPVGSDGLAKPGDYVFSYIVTVDNGSSFVLVTKTYTFDYVAPNVEIEFEVDCDASELTSTDATVYDVISNGVTYSPTSTTRTHTIKEPLGSGYTPTPGSTTDRVRTVGGGGTAGTDLWTKTWQTTISSVISYNLATWGAYTWIVVTDTVTGQDHVDVGCTDCDCDLRQCMLNLFNRWLDAKSGNRKLEMDLQTTWLEAVGYWVEYQTAKSCGLSTDAACQKLKDLLASVDCSCTTDTSDSSVRIVAHSTGTGGGTTPSTFVFWVNSTNPSGGNSGDIWYNYSTYHIWQNVGGTWNDIGSIQGATGPSGADGSSSNANILYNEAGTATSAGTGEETLNSYTIPAATIANDGDVLEIVATYTLASNDNGKTVKIYWGGDEIISYFTDSLVNASNNFVALKGMITRISATSQEKEGYITRFGGFNSAPKISSSAKNLASTVIVSATGQNSVASASDISCNHMRVIYNSFMTSAPTVLAGYDSGIVSLTAFTPQVITFASSMPSASYQINLTATDSFGTVQPDIVVTSITVNGFTVEAPVNVTLRWEANHK